MFCNLNRLSQPFGLDWIGLIIWQFQTKLTRQGFLVEILFDFYNTDEFTQIQEWILLHFVSLSGNFYRFLLLQWQALRVSDDADVVLGFLQEGVGGHLVVPLLGEKILVRWKTFSLNYRHYRLKVRYYCLSRFSSPVPRDSDGCKN